MVYRHDIANDKKIRNYGGVFTYVFEIKTSSPQKIRIRVSDEYKPNTYYLNRYKTVNGVSKIYVRMPQSPNNALIEFLNEGIKRNGFGNNFGSSDNFQVISKKIIPLTTKFSAFDISNPLIKEFVFFAQEFSENSGVLSTRTKIADHSVLLSNRSNFRIDYYDVIKGRDGRVLNTPANIGVNSGIISVSKKHFDQFTVAGRMALLLHEFSHYYLNKTAKSEEEADLNALLIYLGLGYPRIEAETVFLNTFDGNATDDNVERYKKIKSVISNFDNADLKLI